MSWIVRTSAYKHHNARLAVEIKVNSQSMTDNSTLLSYRVYADNTGYSTSWVTYYSRSVTINGTTVYSASNQVRGYKNQTFKTGTIRIPHNSDGSKSIKVSLGANIYSSSGNYKTGSQSITLPRIDRGIYNFKLGTGWDKITGPKTVTFSKYNSDVTVQIVTSWWDYTKSEKTVNWNVLNSSKVLGANMRSGETLYLQDDVIENIKKATPNNWKGWVYVQAWVHLNGKRIETHTLEVPRIIVSESRPSLSFTAEFIGTNQSLLGSKTKGLKGVHKLKLNFNASARDYASIKRYEIEFEGKKTTTTKSSIELNATRPGNNRVSVKVLDSRDWSASSSKLVDVVNYELPKLSHKAFRVENGKENPIGETARISGLVSIYSVKNTSGTEVNEAWWQLSLDNIKRNTNSIMYSQTLSINNERTYTLKYGDKFTTASISGVIPVGHAPLVLGKESVGVNVVPPINGRGLYIQDGLINGYATIPVLDLYTSNTSKYTTAGVYGAVIDSWDKIPPGISIAQTRIGSRGGALIQKYEDGLYGSFVSFGWGEEGGSIRRFRINKGVWEEQKS